jgi:hypothetical protein
VRWRAQGRAARVPNGKGRFDSCPPLLEHHLHHLKEANVPNSDPTSRIRQAQRELKAYGYVVTRRQGGVYQVIDRRYRRVVTTCRSIEEIEQYLLAVKMGKRPFL